MLKLKLQYFGHLMPGSGPSDFLGPGEASAVQVEGVAWAGEPMWAGDLGQRAAEGSRKLRGGVCM